MTSVQNISFSRQIFYLLLHIAALVCGLWMVHSPGFTFAMLLLAPVSMLLSRIPMKVFPVWLRQIVQLAYAAAAVFWLRSYLPVRPIGALVMEFGCIVFPALYLLRSRQEHNMLVLGILGIVFYGSLYPNRAVFLPSFTAVLLIAVFMLYLTRISFLGIRRGNSHRLVSSGKQSLGVLRYCVCHFGCVMILTMLLISQFSLTRRFRTWGMVPVDWNVQQELKFPKMWSEWTAPLQKYMPGKNGRLLKQNFQKLPEELQEDRNAERILPGNGTAEMNGRGASGSLGDELVFRAVVPARMYWMVQAYDTYDGRQWTRSKSMTRGKSSLDDFVPDEFYYFVQNIVMLRPSGRSLPYVFSPVKLSWADSISQGEVMDFDVDGQPQGVIRRRDHIVYEVLNRHLPDLPWKYTVESRIPSPDLKTGRLDPPDRNRGWNYLQLPRTKISPRMRRLAVGLTSAAENRMEKAMILQNYLKENFHYTLTPEKLPPDAEVCDYFLFESREGYCQHFAQALTVLARLAGLQARLVVGYSPGNYNFLANCFEVYEYHGHAWTQIFIEPYGWLTFDGTPPGALPDVAGPKLLQKLLDPFGERRDSRPPEISFMPSGGAVNPEEERLGTEKKMQGRDMTLAEVQQKALQVYEKIYDEASRKHPDRSPTMNEMMKAGGKLLLGRLKNAWQKIRRAAFMWKNRWKTFLLEQGRKLMAWSRTLTLWNCGCMLTAAALLYEGWNRRRMLARALKRLQRKWNIFRLRRKIQQGTLQGKQLADSCQKLVFMLLQAAGIRRLPAQDVFEYGEHLRKRRPDLCEDYLLVASWAARCWYGTPVPDREQCSRIVGAVERLQNRLNRR